jgi:hypothetical protein
MGYFGRSPGARPSRHLAAVDVDLGKPGIPPKLAICGQCDAHAVLIDDKLPNGWAEIKDPTISGGKDARCPACKPISRPSAVTATIGPDPAQDHPPVGRMYSGVRIIAWPIGGNVILRMHGGETPRPGGRDEPIHFLATPEDLDQMIIHFAALREQLKGDRANG